MQQDNQRSYRRLVVWQKADELAFQIYLITKSFPKEEMFGLTSQMRRAAISITSNIVPIFTNLKNWIKIEDPRFCPDKFFIEDSRHNLIVSEYKIGAEGFSKHSAKEKIQFYMIVRGSLTELEYFIDFSLRLKYLSDEQHLKLTNLRNKVGRPLNGFINSIKNETSR